MINVKRVQIISLLIYKAANRHWVSAPAVIDMNGVMYVSYRVFNCILVHFIPLPVFIFYSFTGIYILLILFLYSILSTLFPCTLYGLIFPFLFLYFYSIFVYSFSLFSVPAWMGLYRRGWDYTAWSVFV